MTFFRYDLGIFLEGLRKTIKNLNQIVGLRADI
jgi:hypothetical protein